MAGRLVPIALAALALASAAGAQEVAVTPLPAPDLFSAGGVETGLGPDLWRGASAQTARAVIPLLAEKSLSPAAQALARRLLGTAATAPEGAGRDAELAGARVQALMAMGGVAEARAILQRTPGLDSSPDLARAAAEASLLAYDAQRACAIAEALTVDRDEIYWLRLRAYCQLRAGQAGAAQLTFDLAQGQSRDAIYGRLMGVKLAGGGDPGGASLRSGLDYVLSRDLGLDLAQAKPAPAVAAALNSPSEALLPDPNLVAAEPTAATLEQFLAQAAAADDAKARAKSEHAALILAALGAPVTPQARGELAGYAAETKAPASRLFALDLAAEQKLAGETALLALWVSAEAGATGLAIGDRVRIVRALRVAGLEADARGYALEGLAALQ